MKVRTAVFIILSIILSYNYSYSQEIRNGALLLTLPDVNWVLEVNCPGFVITQKEFNAKRDGIMVMGNDTRNSFTISCYLLKAPQDANSKSDPNACRDYYWKDLQKGDFQKQDVKFSNFGPLAITEYMTKEFRGVKMEQKNLFAYLVKDNYWIDMHISKVRFNESNIHSSKTVLENIKILPKDKKQTTKVNYSLEKDNILELDLPNSWVDEIELSDQNCPTIKITPSTQEKSQILLTFLYHAKSGEDYDNKNRDTVTKLGNEILSGAIEKELKLEKLSSNSCSGYYFTLTDKSLINAPPKEGEYKIMTQGLTKIGDSLFAFTILTNQPDSKIKDQGLSLIRDAQVHTSNTPK